MTKKGDAFIQIMFADIPLFSQFFLKTVPPSSSSSDPLE